MTRIRTRFKNTIIVPGDSVNGGREALLCRQPSAKCTHPKREAFSFLSKDCPESHDLLLKIRQNPNETGILHFLDFTSPGKDGRI